MKEGDKVDFRKGMFKFCNLLRDTELKQQISQTMHSLNRSEEDNNASELTISTALGSQKIQFLGYLLIDEKIDDKRKNDPLFSKLKHLTYEERDIIETGHMLIIAFIDWYLEDVEKFSKTVSKVINPYYGYNKLNVFNKSKKDLPIGEKDFKKHIKPFSTNVFNGVRPSSNEWDIIKGLPEKELFDFLEAVKRDIYSVGFYDVPSDLQEYSIKKNSTDNDIVQVLMKQILILFSIRETVETAIQMIFTTLCGGDLVVFDNDNIISVDGQFANFLTDGIEIFATGTSLTRGHIVGDLALVTCKLSDTHKIKKFGRIDSTTFSFNREEGTTLKCKIRVVDENLNPFYKLIGSLIR